MLTLDVTYEDFDGELKEEKFNFHLTKLELARWDQENGGIVQVGERISQSPDAQPVLELVEEIVRRSFGVRRGDKFVKDPEETAAFLASEAYSEIVFGFIEDPMELVNFIKGILPKSFASEIDDSEIRAKLQA